MNPQVTGKKPIFDLYIVGLQVFAPYEENKNKLERSTILLLRTFTPTRKNMKKHTNRK